MQIQSPPEQRSAVKNINCHHPTIKFTALWSDNEETLLDTRVYLTVGKISTDQNVKPTNTHQYLQMDSCHPK